MQFYSNMYLYEANVVVKTAFADDEIVCIICQLKNRDPCQKCRLTEK